MRKTVRSDGRRSTWPAVTLALHSCACLACGVEAVQLVQRPQRSNDFVILQRPPPVVPVDIQPTRPTRDAAWVPGSWSWRAAAGWVWNPGVWVDPPAGASWSPWTWCYQADGQVRFWEARWFGPHGEPIDGPPRLGAADRRAERL
jgi:hypothetical protein